MLSSAGCSADSRLCPAIARLGGESSETPTWRQCLLFLSNGPSAGPAAAVGEFLRLLRYEHELIKISTIIIVIIANTTSTTIIIIIIRICSRRCSNLVFLSGPAMSRWVELEEDDGRRWVRVPAPPPVPMSRSASRSRSPPQRVLPPAPRVRVPLPMQPRRELPPPPRPGRAAVSPSPFDVKELPPPPPGLLTAISVGQGGPPPAKAIATVEPTTAREVMDPYAHLKIKSDQKARLKGILEDKAKQQERRAARAQSRGPCGGGVSQLVGGGGGGRPRRRGLFPTWACSLQTVRRRRHRRDRSPRPRRPRRRWPPRPRRRRPQFRHHRRRRRWMRRRQWRRRRRLCCSQIRRVWRVRMSTMPPLQARSPSTEAPLRNHQRGGGGGGGGARSPARAMGRPRRRHSSRRRRYVLITAPVAVAAAPAPAWSSSRIASTRLNRSATRWSLWLMTIVTESLTEVEVEFTSISCRSQVTCVAVYSQLQVAYIALYSLQVGSVTYTACCKRRCRCIELSCRFARQ